jgi:hypothetical protein
MLASVLPPLVGGGFLVALAQAAVFYYALGALLHWGLPALTRGRLQHIQEAPRKPGEVWRDARNSLGELVACGCRWLSRRRVGGSSRQQSLATQEGVCCTASTAAGCSN